MLNRFLENAKLCFNVTLRYRLYYVEMAYDFGAIEAFVAAAVGGDKALARDLHATFTQSINHYADLLARSRCDANWYVTAHRLKGLAASFAATGIMDAAEFALNSAPGDPVALRKVNHSIGLIPELTTVCKLGQIRI